MAAHSSSFESVLTFWAPDAALVRGGETRTITCEVVSDNYFAALGLRPVIGTFFSCAPGETLPAVLSSGFWQEAFGGRRDIIGTGVRIRGAPFTVVGVGPAKFGRLDLERRADVWVPPRAWSAWTGKADTPVAPAQIQMVLKDRVSLSQAESEIPVLYPSMGMPISPARRVSRVPISRRRSKSW
jgi:hypothetical protein